MGEKLKAEVVAEALAKERLVHFIGER